MVACTTLPKRPRCNEKSYGWVARLCSNAHRRRCSWPNCLGCRGRSRHRNHIQVDWRDCWFSRNVHSGFRVRKATQSVSLHRMWSSNSTKQSKEQCPHSIPRPLTLRSSGTVLRRVASRRPLTSNVRRLALALAISAHFTKHVVCACVIALTFLAYPFAQPANLDSSTHRNMTLDGASSYLVRKVR